MNNMYPVASGPPADPQLPAFNAEVPVLSVPEALASPLPRLGLSTAGWGPLLTPLDIGRLSALQLAHLRIDLRLANPVWPAMLSRAAWEARQLGARLEIAIHLPPQGGEDELLALPKLLEKNPTPLARILVFRQGEAATSASTLQLARRCLGALDAPLAGGTNTQFSDLEREQALGRFGLAEADLVAWPILGGTFSPSGGEKVGVRGAASGACPQSALGNSWRICLLENLAAQARTVAAARVFAHDWPFAVTPVTLQPRDNAAASEAPADSLQGSLVAAAWTLASLATLAQAGVDSVTFCETTGPHGVMQTGTGRAPTINLFPVYHLFAALAGFKWMAPLAGAPAAGSTLPAGAALEAPGITALCLFDQRGNRRILLADLTGKGQRVIVRLRATAARFALLDVSPMKGASPHPQHLLPRSGREVRPPSGCLELALAPDGMACLDELA